MNIFQQLGRQSGDTALYYRCLETGNTIMANSYCPIMAASVIKLFIMGAAYAEFAAGRLSRNLLITAKRADIVPSCGAINLLGAGRSYTVSELVRLMIALSDNTATNLLIKHIGYKAINGFIEREGFAGTALRRQMYDTAASSKGIHNTVTAAACAQFLESAYRGRLVGRPQSAEMLDILMQQKLNGKLPFYLEGVRIAHKTGEDRGISHDVGIIYARRPFLVCFLSQNTCVSSFERFIQQSARELYLAAQ